MSTPDPRTNDQLNRIIAEWMGYTDFRQGRAHKHWFCRKPNELIVGTQKNNRVVCVPLYCTRLDLMAQAEKHLDHNQWAPYCDLLTEHGEREGVCYSTRSMATICAGPRVRAENLVKVIESK